MEQTTFTRKELAMRWGLTLGSISNMEKEGSITRCKKLPGVRYSAKSVIAAEESDFNPMSPSERRRLEREVNLLREQADFLKGIIGNITAIVGNAICNERRF